MAETASNAPERAEPQFAERLERAKGIVAALEKGDLDLEQGVRLYREASECLAFCRRRLAEAKNVLERLNGELERAEDFLAQDQQGRQ